MLLVAAKTKLCTTVQMIAARKSLDRPVVPLTFALVRVCVLVGAFVLVFSQNRLWGLFARHTTMSLIILYLVYSQVSTVVSTLHTWYTPLCDRGLAYNFVHKYSTVLLHVETV